MKEISISGFGICALIGAYCMIVFVMGGITTGLIYQRESPIEHKWTMLISGNLWFFAMLFLILFLR